MVFSGGAVTCPVDDPTLLPGAELTLDRLPPAYYARSPEGILLLTAGKMGEEGPGAGCDGPVAKIARDVRVTGYGEHPVMLLDFKAGFEDAARGAITSLDLVLVTVDATQAALQMAVDLKAMVVELQAGTPPATQHLEFPELAELARRLFREARVKQVYVVLNKVSSAAGEAYMREQLAGAGIEPLGVLRPNSRIARAWLRGEPLVEDGAGSGAGSGASSVGDWIAKAMEADQRVRAPAMSRP
jgi:CO dehydrogenase nickel-insertion accessory protein CooC1